MSPIAKSLIDYVNGLGDSSNRQLDIVFGKVLYTSSYSAVYTDTILLPEANLRILLDANKPESAIVMALTKQSDFGVMRDVNDFTHDFKNKCEFSKVTDNHTIIEAMNKIFAIVENNFNRPISEITMGVFNYYDTK